MNKKIKDPVFGEIEYKYNWVKNTNFIFWGNEYSFRIVAQAYTGQEILDIQREKYTYFLKNLNSISENSIKELNSYYKSIFSEIQEYLPDRANNISPENISQKKLLDFIKPISVIFNRDGVCGILCDCEWDKEHGIAIICTDEKIHIGSQDEIL